MPGPRVWQGDGSHQEMNDSAEVNRMVNYTTHNAVVNAARIETALSRRRSAQFLELTEKFLISSTEV
jgi:hypothetical protein